MLTNFLRERDEFKFSRFSRLAIPLAALVHSLSTTMYTVNDTRKITNTLCSTAFQAQGTAGRGGRNTDEANSTFVELHVSLTANSDPVAEIEAHCPSTPA